MNERARAWLEQLRTAGLSPAREDRLRLELETAGDHSLPEAPAVPDYTPGVTPLESVPDSLYAFNDLDRLQALAPLAMAPIARLGSLDDLMARDNQRETDGFPRKIRIGKLVKPGKGGRNKVVVVPTTVEELSLIHISEPTRPY